MRSQDGLGYTVYGQCTQIIGLCYGNDRSWSGPVTLITDINVRLMSAEPTMEARRMTVVRPERITTTEGKSGE